MVYERFSDRARKVLQFANQEAQRFNHDQINTAHVLLGLVKENSGVAANVLKNLNIDLGKVRQEVEKQIVSGPPMVTMGKLTQTEAVKQALQFAIQEASALKNNYIGTEHIMLGLIRCKEAIAGSVLKALGVTCEQVRKEVMAMLAPPKQTQAQAQKHDSDGPVWYTLTNAIDGFVDDEVKKELKKEREVISAKFVEMSKTDCGVDVLSALFLGWLHNRINGKETVQHNWTVTCVIGTPIKEGE